MEIELKNKSRHEVMHEYLDKFIEDEKQRPKSGVELGLTERSIIDRLCGFNETEHQQVKMLIDTAFWAGIWFGKTNSKKVMISDSKSNINIIKLDYTG